jgi:hypothetical protein
MRGTLLPLVGAIAAGGFLSAFTPSPDVAPDDVYAWRWTIDTILDAQKKASRREATLPMKARVHLPTEAPNETSRPSPSAARSIPGTVGFGRMWQEQISAVLYKVADSRV